jgi:redox-sensing transcriptional repressor
MKAASEKTIERLSLYRRLLRGMLSQGMQSVYSHQLADRIGGTAAQVRRDLMDIGFSGSSKAGYDVEALIATIGDYLDNPEGEPVALVGMGNLARALLPFYAARHGKLKIAASFDKDPQKAGRVIKGCRCYPMADLDAVLKEQGIRVAILTVPADAAQRSAECLVEAGVRGILNYTSVPLRLPPRVAVEDIDMTVALEKVAFLARRSEADGDRAV